MINFNNVFLRNFSHLNNNLNTLSFCAKKRKPHYDSFEKTARNSKSATLQEKSSLSQETFDKAVRIILKGLNEKEPYEVAVLVNNDSIYDYFDGDAYDVEFDDRTERILSWESGDFTILHGHPKNKNGRTTPVSVYDLKEFVEYYKGVSSVYAINSDGEYSMLRKIPGKYKENNPLFEKLHDEYWQGLSGLLDDKDKADYIEFLKEDKDFKAGKIKKTRENIQKLGEKCRYYYSILNNHKDLPQYVHNFYVKNADKLGLEYKTNFSCLQ